MGGRGDTNTMRDSAEYYGQRSHLPRWGARWLCYWAQSVVAQNQRDYVQAHILVHPPSGLRLNRPPRIPSPNIHRSDPFNPMIGDPASKSSYWAQSLNRPMAKGEFEDSWWKGLPHIRNHLPPSLPAKPWYLGFFFHADNSQTTGQIWDTSARGNSCPEMRGKGSTTKSFEVNRRWRQTEDKKAQCCEWRVPDRDCGLHFAFIWITENVSMLSTDLYLVLEQLFQWEFPILWWTFGSVFAPILFQFGITAFPLQRWQKFQLIGKGHIFPVWNTYRFRRVACHTCLWEHRDGHNQNLNNWLKMSEFWIQTLIGKAHAASDSVAPPMKAPRDLINYFIKAFNLFNTRTWNTIHIKR